MPIKNTAKIAVIHDHLLYLGGAERVLFSLIKMFPTADLYTAFASPKIINQLKKIHQGNYHISIYDNFLLSHKYPDLYKPLINLYWESLDLSKYDLVISLSHSFSSKSVISKPPTHHIAYIYTSPRYLYTEYNETQIIKKAWLKILLSPLMTILRLQDFIGAQRPDVLIACSKAVQKRIWKYYRRKSIVIYPPATLCEAMRTGPPVSIPKKIITNKRKEYFLVVSRLVKQKGIDLAIKACNESKLPLVIVGEGKEQEYLQSISGPTINFLGFVEDNQIPNIYSQAKALIYCSRDEDFGIVPVESMSYGVPVIALRQGGVIETVIEGKTGLFFDKPDIKELVKAIKQFSNLTIDQSSCIKQASEFSPNIFQQKFIALINRYIT